MIHMMENRYRRSRSELALLTPLFIAIAKNSAQFILESLELSLGINDSAYVTTKNDKAIRSLKKDLKFLRCFLERVPEDSVSRLTIVDLVMDGAKLMEVLLVTTDAYARRKLVQKSINPGDFQVSSLIKSIFQKSNITSGDFLEHCSKVSRLVGRIKRVEKSIVKVSDDKDGCSCPENSSRKTDSSIMEEKAMVGLDAEVAELLDKLIGGRKQLEVISIIGMGGIGKTTLAKRLYNDSAAVNRFHVRAWTSVSPNFKLRSTLQDILTSIFHEKDPILNLSDEDMGEKLYKSLKGRRYLIVIDDVWDVNACSELIMYLPNDDKASRILFTSRIQGLAKGIACENHQHFLRFLTHDKSWNLFKQRVFPDNNIPEDLENLGKCILAKCKGLPLAVAVMAGVLAKEKKTVEIWRDFASNVRQSTGDGDIFKARIFFSQERAEYTEYRDILELSYKHLPKPLQSCFLYLGTFPVDYEVPTKRLIWSWIGEGFIWHTHGKRLEDVAKDHLVDLVSRSLVIVMKKSSDGGIKSCKVHDLLRQMCLQKAEERKFLQPVCDCAERSNWLFYKIPTEPCIIDPFSKCRPHFHLSCSSHYGSSYDVFNSSAMSAYKFLRRLELRKILVNFPQQISQLIHLRYLALRIDRIKDPFPSSIFELWKLETCIFDVEKPGRMELPLNIWKMVNLRHLQISQEVILNGPEKDTSTGTVLENLQTISLLCPSGSISNALARTPNLRNLGFHLTLSQSQEPFCFPELAHLNLLQTLKFEYQTLGMVPFSIPNLHKFPPSLKKLTLIGSHVHWEEMSMIGLLPNLEVLKIKDNFFSGPLWETSDEGFCRLKFLKLSHMDLQKWISSSDHFPRLEHLILNGCLELEEIPLEIGDIPTLQTIEVYHSSSSAVESAKQILESQRSMGNDDLKFLFYHHLEEY